MASIFATVRRTAWSWFRTGMASGKTLVHALDPTNGSHHHHQLLPTTASPTVASTLSGGSDGVGGGGGRGRAGRGGAGGGGAARASARHAFGAAVPSRSLHQLAAVTLLLATAALLFGLDGHACALAARLRGEPAQPAQDLGFDAASHAATADDQNRPELWHHATNLIVVAGHAIYRGSRWDPEHVRNEHNWFLEPYQTGLVDTFLAHIRRGVELAANDSRALLLFSGGETRPGVGPRSEAQSYWHVADALNWYGHRDDVINRTLTEEYARDSFENLLFSMCRFRQLSGRYPERVTVVTLGYKQFRFETVHRRALRYPMTKFHFVGIDPPGMTGMREIFAARERSGVLRPFQKDPYGCRSISLTSKRLRRNPLLRFHPYPQGCPEISVLFKQCFHGVFDGELPWDR